jgi:uncharacterized protein (TIGR02594 family)
MQSGTFKDLPKSEINAFVDDLKRQARLEHVTLRLLPVTDNGDDTVDISWIVETSADAASHAVTGGETDRVTDASGGMPADSSLGDRGNAPATPPPARVSGSSSIAGAIRNAASQVGVNVETLASIASIESSFRADAQNPRSSAFGLFQFLDGTWADVCQRRGATFGVNVGQRRDLRAQCLMGAAFLQDNMRSLRNALGREPQPGECYAAHFFGAGTAAHLLQGGHDIRADTALGDRADAVIRANPSVFRDGPRIKMVGEVMQFFDSKMADALSRARGFLSASPTDDAPPVANAASTTDPRWLQIARAEIGQKEAVGGADNPRIVQYFGATTLGEQPDSVSWCGAFVSFCLREAGLIQKGSARAADWLNFGDRLSLPRLGCIAVLKPQAAGSSGHVGFWVGQEGGRIHLLAGNQHDRVDITAWPEAELREGGFRWPPGVP